MSERETPATILCIGSAAQGQTFLSEASQRGCQVLLLTLESLQDADWPREKLAEIIPMPAGLTPEQICARVSYLARHHRIDRIVALSAEDMEAAALLREHMRLPGMGQSTTRLFHDRLAMRVRAQRSGIETIEFVPVLNYERLRAFLDETPGPWLLIPRAIASSEDSRTIDTPQQLWRVLDELGDAQSNYLLERASDGIRYFVEAITWGREIRFSRVLRCSSSTNGLTTQVIPKDGLDARYVLDLHDRLMEELGMAAGITHTEILKTPDGRYRFAETTAGVGPALAAGVIAAATGIDLWTEWARLETAALFGEEYVLPRIHEECAAGSVVTTGEVGLGPLDGEPEVFFAGKGNRGVVVRSADPERVAQLLAEWENRFQA